ncbi:MAG: thioesterase family protein [Parerythrobacter sp.]
MIAADLIAPIDATRGPFTLPDAEQWMQGRTLYGGASALVAFTALRHAYPDLPPLRAAQIGFVAPVGDTIDIATGVVRQGRNVTQLRSEIVCEGATALFGTWLFGAGREANAVKGAAGVGNELVAPEDCQPIENTRAPAFIQGNFEIRHALPKNDVEDTEEARVRWWIRLREPSGLDPLSEVILLGDTLPPSAMRVMQRPGPLSSMNWAFNVIDPAPVTREGWWLAETASEWADAGYSSERLTLWNAHGAPVLSGLQSVAIFG